MLKPIIIGAVLYDPKVSSIWEIIRKFFESHGVPIEVQLFDNYEIQNAALMAGDIDIAWNSPLAWLDLQHSSGDTCRAIAMRDTDRDRVSHLIVRQDSGIQSVDDLRGKTVALGAADSPQARLIPQGLLLRHGLVPERDYSVRRFDVSVGLHGDHVGGEKDAWLCLKNGDADACALIDLNWQAWTQDGTIDSAEFQILATTEPYDHCVFAVRDSFPRDREQDFLQTLFKMSYDNPQHREMMDLEGLKKWEPGRTSGFAALQQAVQGLEYGPWRKP